MVRGRRHIIQAVGLVLNINIDILELTRGAEEGVHTTGRFTGVGVLNAEHTILVLRVNNNHYHATGAILDANIEKEEYSPSFSYA